VVVARRPGGPGGLGALRAVVPGRPGGLETLRAVVPGWPGGLGALRAVVTGRPPGLGTLRAVIPGGPGGLGALRAVVPGWPGGLGALRAVVTGRPPGLGTLRAVIPGGPGGLGALRAVVPPGGPGGLGALRVVAEVAFVFLGRRDGGFGRGRQSLWFPFVDQVLHSPSTSRRPYLKKIQHVMTSLQSSYSLSASQVVTMSQEHLRFLHCLPVGRINPRPPTNTSLARRPPSEATRESR